MGHAMPTPDGYLGRERRVLAIGLVAGAVVMVAGAIAGGLGRQLAAAGLSSVPLIVTGWLAHLGVRRVWAQALSWVGAALLALSALASVVGLAVEAYEGADHLRHGVFIAAAAATLIAIAAATPLATPVLRGLGMRPADHVHRLALFLCLALTAFSLAPLAGTGGRAILLDVLARKPDEDVGSPLDSLLALVWIIPGAFALVGYGVHRGGAVTRDRLGLRWPGRRGALVAVAIGLALVPLALGAGAALEEASRALGLPRTGDDDLEQLFDTSSLTLASSFAIALAAGVGEELAMRGVLQPRLGLVLANLFFASMHAWQYTTDGVIVVFLLGLAFGLLRRRTTTVGSMIAHVTYDFALLALIVAT